MFGGIPEKAPGEILIRVYSNENLLQNFVNISVGILLDIFEDIYEGIQV